MKCHRFVLLGPSSLPAGHAAPDLQPVPHLLEYLKHMCVLVRKRRSWLLLMCIAVGCS